MPLPQPLILTLVSHMAPEVVDAFILPSAPFAF